MRLILPILFSIVLPLQAQITKTTGRPGSEGAGDSSAELLQLLQDRQYLELEIRLRATPVGDPVERAFFEGVLANRSNRLKDAERLLRPLLSGKTRSLGTVQAKIAWRTLADTYTKMFRYAQAADTYDQLLKSLGASLSQAEGDDEDGARSMVEALRNTRGQTVALGAGFIVPTRRNALHTIEAPVSISG